MLSGPQDLLHLILSRTDWIYETRAGWKEKFSLKSRDEIEEMLGWVENSSRLSFRAGWSKTGVEKNELKKFEGSLMTLPSSMRWISSKETSLLAEGNRGFRFFQKLLDVLALEAESAQNRLIATRFSLVTMFLCVLQCFSGTATIFFVQFVSQAHRFLYLYIDPGKLIRPNSLFYTGCVFLYYNIK